MNPRIPQVNNKGKCYKFPGDFRDGSFIPVEEFDDRLQRLMALANPDDGFFYAVQRTVRPNLADPDAAPEVIPSTTRPAPVFRLAPSHILEIRVPLLGEFRQHDGAFLMHLAGYLHGYRLQFHDWWFDGRLPLSQSTHHVVMSKSAADDFLSQAYDCWRGWDEASRRSFINILYMHARAPAYQWHWESFLIDYMVLDALYRLAHAIHGVSARIHGARIEALCTFYGLWYDPVVAGEIVSLRNELFHEALWSGDSPGSSFDEQVYDRTQCLRDLNQRLIPAMLGFQGAYTRSAWINWLSAHAFE